MIATTDLSQRICSIFANRLHLEVSRQDADLFEAGVLDSLAVVDLISELEREFGFRLPFGQLNIDDFRSLDRIAKFVEQSQLAQEA
jgi:D-alanine--poly(phosphoribitol) ligase subunit 2